MKIEQQVCSLELAKKLKELGVKQESAFYWTDSRNNTFELTPGGYAKHYAEEHKIIQYAAFTVAELGEMLPPAYYSLIQNRYQWVCYDDKNGNGHAGKNEADARAAMLVHLIEQGIVKPCPHG